VDVQCRALNTPLPSDLDQHQELRQVRDQLAHTPMNAKDEFEESHSTKELQLVFWQLIVEVQTNE
jgi:hypothetical protein